MQLQTSFDESKSHGVRTCGLQTSLMNLRVMVSEPAATSDKFDESKSHGVRTRGDLSKKRY
ncbi:hypothetical protein MLOOGBEN_26450 [Bacillus sp. EB106-08-02-XG196]|nr:hypothetical protein [Bacillus sp. EB106-08-02-XG196]